LVEGIGDLVAEAVAEGEGEVATQLWGRRRKPLERAAEQNLTDH
jgi:hypothetical protein